MLCRNYLTAVEENKLSSVFANKGTLSAEHAVKLHE